MKLDSSIQAGIHGQAVHQLPPGTEVRRHTPVENALLNVAAALALVLGTGLLGLLGGLAFVWMFGLSVKLAAAGGIGGMALMSAWLFRGRRERGGTKGGRRLESLLWTEETALRVEPVEQSAAVPVPVNWQMNPDRNTTLLGHFTEEIEVVREWAQAALTGNSLAINTWRKRFRDYAEFRRNLTNRSQPLLVDRGKAGCDLTEDGILWCYEILETEPGELIDGEIQPAPLPGPRLELPPPTRSYTHQHTVGGSE